MALQLKRSRSLVSMKTGGALLAIFAFLIQSIVALDLPVAFASTPVSTASVTADKDNEYRSAAVDGSKFLDLTFSFDYDARSLDATSNQDSFSYGWTVGGVDHPLGTVEGTQGNNPSEVDSISKPLPSGAYVSGLTVYVKVDSDHGSPSDDVELTNIKLDGTDKPVIQACSTTNVVTVSDLNSWYLGETRTGGHNELLTNGLHAWTDSNTSEDKAAGYFYGASANFDLKDVGVPSIEFASYTDGRPSLQLGFDKDGNGTWDGYLVYEPWAYGDGKYWSSHDFGVGAGGGYPSMGTLQQYLDANPSARIISVGYSLGSGLKGDAVISSLTAGCTKYVFAAPPYTYSSDDSSFVGSPKYVRENNFTTDISAQIRVPAVATDVRFSVDGGSPIQDPNSSVNEDKDGDIYKVSGAASGSQWWRLQKSLPAGEHSVTAQYKVNSIWYDVTGTGTVYSLDAPWAQYIVPQSNQFFRPNDRVVRIKADDEFNQFKSMVTTINGVQHVVVRADCNDQGSYVLCDLSGLNLPEGSYVASTTTYTQANNRVDNLLSPEFTIDGTAPVMLNAAIVSPTGVSVYKDSVEIAQYVKEENPLNGVSFYITKPRADGMCDPNEPKVLGPIDAHFVNHNPAQDTWYYRTTVDTSSLNGVYCIFSVAEDAAMNHSNPQTKKFSAVFDNQGPTVSISSPTGTVSNNGKTITVEGTVDQSDISGVSRVDIQVKNGTTALDIDTDSSPKLIQAVVSGGTWTATIPANVLPEGDLTIVAIAKDNLNNTKTTTQPITVDNTAPMLSNFTAVRNNSDGTYTLSVTTNDPGAGPVSFEVNGTDQTGATSNSDGTVWSVVTDVLDFGTYAISASQSDAAGNSATVTGSITVSKDNLPTSSPTLQGPIQTLSQPQLQTTTPNGQNPNNTDGQADAAVLGAKTPDSKDDGNSNVASAVQSSGSGWKILGLAWYWWVAILGAAGALWWFFAARSHRGSDA